MHFSKGVLIYKAIVACVMISTCLYDLDQRLFSSKSASETAKPVAIHGAAK